MSWLGEVGKTARHWLDVSRRRAPIVFLDQRWVHHGRRSGYLIAEEGDARIERSARLLPQRVVAARARRTGDRDFEQRGLLWAELALGGAKLVHVIDGDFDTWAYAPRPRWVRARVTATFHQPIDTLPEVVKGLAPGALDGIVCMSRPQIPLLEPFVPAGRCVFVPHGVETRFFHPAPEARAKERPVLLSVGAHRRDFATLIAAAKAIRAERPDAVVRLVVPRKVYDDVRARAGHALEILSGISDEELRAQYQAATLLLLPLEAATANNAVLEAMACGLPIVVTDVPDLHDYVTGEAAVFCPHADPAAHASAALSLLGHPDRLVTMARAARAQAEPLAWPKVRARAREFFESVIG